MEGSRPMSARSFKGITMVASCAAAALGCYLVSLRVASERAALENVETQIVLAQRDIRLLQTEIGTRGRLAQLERWNVKVLALSAPSADQILGGGFELAKLVAPPHRDEVAAPVVLASAPADAPKPRVAGSAASDEQAGIPTAALLHQTSLTREIPSARRMLVQPAEPAPVAHKLPPPEAKAASATVPKAKPRAIAAPALPTKAAKPVAAPAVPVKAAKAVATKPNAAAKAKAAAADPLAPLAGAAKKPKTVAANLKPAAKEPARKP
jgi:hypothetical protein